METIDLLPYIYGRFYKLKTPTEPSEIEAEKLLAKIIENDIDYDITNVKIYGKKYERILEKESDYKNKVDNHMRKRYDICRKLGIKDHNGITNAVPASKILEKAKMNISKKRLALVYSVKKREFDIDYYVLEQICGNIYDYDDSGIFTQLTPPPIVNESSGDESEEDAYGGGGKSNKRRKSKKRKSKRRKSKRRKTRRKKR